MTRLPPFKLHAPESVEEATSLLERFGDDAALYCGGTELLLLMKVGFAEFRHLVDVKGIPELGGIDVDGGCLSIGAAVTHRELERHPMICQAWPALAAMERSVANLRVRSVGTIGGNLCFADPHSDPATFLLASGATVVARRGSVAVRRIPAELFTRGPYQTALEPGELVTRIEIPATPRGSIAHNKFIFRERPAATATCLLRVDQARIVEARIAVGSVGPIPVRVGEAEAKLIGMDVGVPDLGLVKSAAETAGAASGATDDANGSADYKAHLSAVLVQRALMDILARVGL